MIDFEKIFHCLPQITGFEWTSKGKHYISNHYMDGSVSSRKDKLVATLGSNNDGITLIEQGGNATTLYKWLFEFGGCNSDKEVLKVLSLDTTNVFVPPKPKEKPSRYVDRSRIIKYNYNYCNLYKFLCKIYGINKVKHAFDLYEVFPTPIYHNRWATTFLYINNDGNICHDKKIKYTENGKRDKSFTGFRTFKTDDGYSQRCLFGEHLIKNYMGKIRICESEKTALIFYLEYGHICLATGGSNNISQINKKHILLRDYDLAGEKWQELFPTQCPNWWVNFDNVEIGDDIADCILRKYL